jgi:vancomycin resistance protein YoaR
MSAGRSGVFTFKEQELRLILGITTGAVLVAGVGAAAGVHVRNAYFPAGETLPGLTVDGAPVAGNLSNVVSERARARLDRRVRFEIDGAVVAEAKLSELGAHVDENRSEALARDLGHVEDLSLRADLASRAAKGNLDVPLFTSVDAAPLVKLFAKIKEDHDKPPMSARLDFDHGGARAETSGKYIDIDSARARVAEVAASPSPDGHDDQPQIVALQTCGFAPRLVSSFVEKIDVAVTLSSFDTFFSRNGDQARRGKNIDVAATKLDGLVLMPDVLVSFNDVVGARNEDNGFSKSWEIYKGEMVEGVGGGTCQVASTLHAAAFFGGLDIVERLPHSRPSAYIPMGLDATVVYPVVDMKLKNPYAFPVVVHAVSEGNKLHVEIRGEKKLAHVTFEREVKKILPYDRKIEEKTGISRAKVIVKQHGVSGFKIERKRILAFADGRKREEKENDTYPPTNEVFEVAPGFDTSVLPPPPAALAADEGDDAADTTSDAPAQPITTSALAANLPANVSMQDAPGAHPPTAAQLSPEPTLTIKR